MNAAAEAYLASLGRFGIKPGLERVRLLLRELGDPHRGYPVVHVAGTNGKGSVCTLIAAGYQAAGFRTGLFTKPHLTSYNERIAVSGRAIDDAAFGRWIDRLRPIVDRVTEELGSPTEFDVGTALAFAFFAEMQVDVAVVETGLGGTWDSTNVIDPALSVITPIGMDHSDVLGDTISAIAGEKAGIIKPGRPVVVGPQAPEALQVLLERAVAGRSPAVRVERQAKGQEAMVAAGGSARGAEGFQGGAVGAASVRFEPLAWDRTGGLVRISTGSASHTYRVGMLGAHQLENAAIAVAAWEALDAQLFVPATARAAALSDTRVPGRLELISGAPPILLDGGHNARAAEALGDALAKLFDGVPVTLLFGTSQDKPADAMLRSLLPHAACVVTAQAVAARLGGWSAEQLAALCRQMAPSLPIEGAASPAEALARAQAQTPPNGLICVCGSMYLIREVRPLVLM